MKRESKRSKKRHMIMIIKRICVVAAFAVTGICYVSAGKNEKTVFKTEKVGETAFETSGNNSDTSSSLETGKTTRGTIGQEKPIPQLNDNVNNSAKNDKEENEAKAETTSETILSDREALTRDSLKININTAGERELTSLKGIGPAKAQKIISYRTANGDFKRTEDLMLVPGIKEGTYSKIKDNITVGQK